MMKRRCGEVELRGTAKNRINDGFLLHFHSNKIHFIYKGSKRNIRDERGISNLGINLDL